MILGHHTTSRHLTLRTTERARRDRGYVVVLFAMLLVPLLLLTGFAVDIGLWYNKTSDIRKAADAAALAGVVWLPDVNKARSVALATAAKNGFVPNDHVTITVTPSTQADNRLKVTIRDDRVGSFFYEALGGGTIDLQRTSFAEYILRVPLGSPRNFFGLGTLFESYTGTGFTPEYLYQAVNPYCTDKVNGDRYQSGYDGGTCSGTANTEFRTKGYEMYIDAVANRPSTIDLRLYDPRYNDQPVSNNQQTGQTCTIAYAANWTINTVANARLNGPAQYQTRNSNTSTNWSSTVTLPTGNFVLMTANRVRYKQGVETCVPIYGQETGPDNFRQAGNEDYTFTLFQADNTPLNDNDNPVMCSKTFSRDTAFEFTYLGSVRWNTMPCSITTGMPNGRYILRVHNHNGVSNPEADGSNQWGLVARYTSASGDGLCDGRSDGTCPRVYGKEAISVKAASTAQVASFFLAEIGPEHIGKKLRLYLFDPGEGGQSIQIMQPSGTNGNTWSAHAFNWSSPGVSGSPATNVTSMPVTNSRFNGKLVTIEVDLAGYTPPANNNWWQIRYTFSGADVTDRTTWGAEVVGDPVHLVEEY